ncbi:MAG: tail fiber domain-containing protein, partial [Fidelibacterota bacterium]
TVEPGGNVGIGTTTPSEKLDVAGNLKLSAGGALIFPDNTSLTSASLGGSASSLSTPGNAVITADADAAGTGDVQLKTGNNTQMVVTNNGLVGIGTTTPDTKVTISDAAPYIKFNDTEGGNAWQLGSYGGFRFLLSEVYAGGSSERLSVAEGGNVGINNGSPDAMLSIDANGNGDLINTHTSHTTNAKIFQVLQNNSDGMVKVNDANGNTSVQLDGYSGGTSFILSKLGIGTASPQDALQINGGALLKDRLRLMRTSGPNYIDFNNNQDLIFRSIDTTDANAATRMIIQTDGKIGLGTTAPTEFLDLTSSLPYMRYTDTDGGSAWTIGNYGGNRFLFNEVTSTATHERLSLAEGGNIGINNTAPDAKLSVDADSDGDLINAHTSHASNAKIFQVYQSGNDGYLRLNDGNGNNIAQIAGYSQGSSWFNSQYVGIGTSTPAAKLDIEDTNDPVLRMGRADGTYWDQVVTGANSWYYKLRNNGNTYFEMHGDGSGWMQGSLAQNSDQRLKRNIRTIDSAVEKITRLRGVKYQWRGDEFPNRHFDNNFHLGFIAQEIESVFPELVQEGSDGYKSVIYNGITPVLVEAVKEQQREIEELKGQNQTLQETLQQIQAQLNQLTEGSGNY